MPLTVRDLSRLKGVHPDLVKVIRAAADEAEFMVLEGVRTLDRQRQLVASGASRTLHSRHLTGHAVDIAPLVGGKVRWDWPLFYPLADTVLDIAREMGVSIVWGGHWTSFPDGPHFELNRKVYP